MVETTNIEINTCYVKVPNNDLEIDAYLAQPAHKATFGAVKFFQKFLASIATLRISPN